MIPDADRSDLLEASVLSSWALGFLLLMAMAGWFAAHWFHRPIRSVIGRWPLQIARLIVGVITLWLFWQFWGRMLLLSSTWSLWASAIIGAIAIETVVWVYELEKALVPLWRGRILMGLRLLAVAMVLGILVEPVVSRIKERTIEREVVILVDDSESMQLGDSGYTLQEKLSIASLFEPDLLADQPRLAPLIREISSASRRLRQEMDSLRSGGGSDDTMLTAQLENRAETLGERIAELKQSSPGWQSTLTSLAEEGNAAKDLLMDLARRTGEQVPEIAIRAEERLTNREATELLKELDAILAQLDHAQEKLPEAQDQLSESFFANLSDAEKERIETAAALPRADIARELLQEETEAGQSVYQRLAERYSVRFVRFGRDSSEFDGDAWLNGESMDPDEESGFRVATDMGSAMEGVLEKVPAESLAGVLLLSDGRHNAGLPVEDAARQMGAQGSPLCALPLGSRTGPRDASILLVEAPESIYLGDRIRVNAQLKLDGLRGKTVTARLFSEGTELEEQEIQVPEDQFRTEVRFMHTPEDKGIFDYSVAIDPVEDELFDNNNRWEFKSAVSDDRTNVLVVDSYPRWEFRYLRNLFYGRDKSVHLQYVLLNPDEIYGLNHGARIHASAARAFGDARATHLPRSADEWKKFDAIILGDIPPAALEESTWETIRECIADQGSMLVLVAGQRYMPAEFDNPVVRELLPITWMTGSTADFGSRESYRLELSAAGSAHPLLEQSVSRALNQRIWGSIPSLPWRYLPTGIKEGAEVLAYAVPEDERGARDLRFTGDPGDVQSALEKLANQKEYEQENALVVTQRFGLGSVVMLNFDSTWRFRYGVGDTWHHRFWGQLMRWGTGQNLRSGGEFLRLGTDRLSYAPGDPVTVTAEVLGSDRQPVTEGPVTATLLRGSEELQRLQLRYQEGSNGIFETIFVPPVEEGTFSLELGGRAIEESLEASELENVSTELAIVPPRSTRELSELTVDRDYLNQTAQLAGGTLLEMDQMDELFSWFGAAREVVRERDDLKLWDTWPLLLMFIALVTAEWIFRRRSGLA